ncbi:hypothetical protein [Pseudoalteromonas luteoviolacea]|uniref:Threonine dehydratase n=1 Tax=Pseudoalteromonas luteoviolacea S4054 TaxID=1129367 RepID=A0A0F6AFQ7_9GAMM|nr:hypothetical protein [Pseudoalteromonas luteoviolacea]AOT08278.1 hypothetical protein S4054249_10680 [Pseudoalteromonas luteoviolacea]AOT13194.1 hypothetical protein S40542_10655 [Pseudoalteromonas luteoviolacea]AOT18107.1 hypothetical protein S4054_10655 [Pseudoalteromonas luteoviolacea]KKE84214.1 hypothetical protein N479_09960 [Pseudoalteromonas luteoviolacea S4054]KZN76181.1 hypothetical protein N481_07455 [Pseudoalteromonas luteoviolacea S4047-1]
MSCSQSYKHINHTHDSNCGHTAIRHGDHIDYLVDGKLHHPHGDHCDEHTIEVNSTNPDVCNQAVAVTDHVHGPNCGHEAIQHGDHIDYIVDGRLHHQHGDHCDDHGPIELL